MDDLRDHSEDGIYPDMLSANRSFQTLPTCTKQKTIAHDLLNEEVKMGIF